MFYMFSSIVNVNIRSHHSHH